MATALELSMATEKILDVRGRCVGGAALADEIVIDDNVPRLRTEDGLVRLLPVRHADDRQRPDVGLVARWKSRSS